MGLDAAVHTPRPLLGKVLANAGVLLTGRVANAVISIAYLAVAARMLGARDVGVLILINAFAQLVADVVTFNSWQTVLHFGAAPLAEGRRGDLQQVIRFTIFNDVLSVLGGMAVAQIAIAVAGDHLGWGTDHSHAASIYCLSIIFMVAATPLGLMRLFNRFDLLAAQAPITSGVRLAGSALALVFGASLSLFLAIWAAGTAATFAYTAWVCLKEMKRRDLISGFRWRGPLARGLPGAWRFAWATNLSGSVDTAFTHAVTLVVGAVVGPASAALWRIGRQVADALVKPAKLLVPALYPELARLNHTEGEKAMRKLASQVGLVGGSVATGALVVSAFAGEPLLRLILGEAFASGAVVMTWQVAAAAISIWALPLEPMLVSLGRPGDALKVRFVVAALLLLVLAPVVKTHGLVGAGAALVCAMAALAVGMFLMLRWKRPPKAKLSTEYEITCADDPAQAKRAP